MGNKKTTAMSRAAILYRLDKGYEQLKLLELRVIELNVTAAAMEKILRDSFEPYLQKKKPFTRESMASYTKGLEELQHLQSNALMAQKELDYKRILHENRRMYVRRMEKKKKGT